jgi:small subunit ribosomal protein S1
MTDPNTPDPNTPPAADVSSPQVPASRPVEGSKSLETATSTESATSMEAAPSNSSSADAPASSSAGGDGAAAQQGGPGRDGGGEARGEKEGATTAKADGETAKADGETAKADGETAKAGAEGAPAKKRRRRRRKKKGAAAAAPAEGQATEGAVPAEGASADGAQAKGAKPKKERQDRERPAFNVGDVVFGKVIEFTEDALFVDLSGKAKAIFDLRELLITEDDVEEYTRADKKEAEELAAARAAPASEEPSTSAPADGEAASADAAEKAQPAEQSASSAEAAPAEAAAPADGATATQPATGEAPAASTRAPAAEAQSGEEKPEEKNPQLPRVILEPGAPFVGLVHNDGVRGGLVVLTHHPKRVQKTKPIVAEAAKTGSLVFGLVTGTIKGGVEVDVDGLRAFAPASHVELRPGADLSHLVGKRLPFAVTHYAKRGRDVVLSRRAILENEAKERREEALKNIEMGSIVDGVVRTVVPFGAFIDVGGVEGLVPLSEMSHNRADQPKDVFKVGETVKVKVLRLDERGKLWLSRKAAMEDPWNQVAEKYAPGTRHKGKVARLQPFGAFIELEPGIDGLVHTADLSLKRIEHPEEVVKVGEEIEVVVASVDAKQHRIALHPAPTGEAANEEPQRVQLHKTLKVVVVNVEPGGLVVRVLGATGRNARGFISAAATGTPRGSELRKLFPIGKQLEAKVVEHDPRRGELKLSIKALNEENERNAFQQYRAQVKREAKFGTLADLLAKRNITPSK